jgi:hypothetical protein
MTISELKSHLEPLSGVPAGNQKLMYKSMLDDNKTVGACALKVSAAPKIIIFAAPVRALQFISEWICAGMDFFIFCRLASR